MKRKEADRKGLCELLLLKLSRGRRSVRSVKRNQQGKAQGGFGVRGWVVKRRALRRGRKGVGDSLRWS